MKLFFLNTGLLFWLLALFSWVALIPQAGEYFAASAIILFIFHILKSGELSVFGIRKKQPFPSVQEKDAQGTVVASNVCLEGNLVSTGQVFIFGEVKGDIHAADGQVCVMSTGKVKGNISSPVLLIDGSVEGECFAETLEIFEHGRVQGKLTYTTLAVTRGGQFSGSAINNTEHPGDKSVQRESMLATNE